MRILLVSLFLLVGASTFAEEKTCAVKGMHCQNCVDDLKAKLCEGDKFSVCEVTLKDKKQQLGQFHIKTKEKSGKVDDQAITSMLADLTYTMDKCTSKN